MYLDKWIAPSAIAAGVYYAIGIGASASDHPPVAPPVSYHERCAQAMVPVLRLKPEEPAAGDTPVRRLTKLRYACAFRRLELAAQRLAHQGGAPDALLPILADVGESRLELCGDSSALIPVLEARLGLARIIEELKEAEVDVGRSAWHELEDARYARLHAEVELARATETLEVSRQDRTTMKHEESRPRPKRSASLGARRSVRTPVGAKEEIPWSPVD